MTEIHGTLSELLPEIIRLSEDIYCHPELGFKEFDSRREGDRGIRDRRNSVSGRGLYRSYGHSGLRKTGTEYRSDR